MLRSQARETIIAKTNSWNWADPITPKEVDELLTALESAGLRFEEEDDLYWSKFRHETAVRICAGKAPQYTLSDAEDRRVVAERCCLMADALIEELRK